MTEKRKNAFAPGQRRRIPSLCDLSKQVVKDWISKSLDERSSLVLDIGKVRRYVRKATMPLIREQLLHEMMPYDNPWKFGCLLSKKKTQCRLHQECKVTFNHCSRLIKFLFSPDMETLKINLRKVSSNNFEGTFRAIIRIIKMSDYCRLKKFYLVGGGIIIDEFLPLMEDLCYFLRHRAKKLVKLHLPVASNSCLETIATMPSLQCLIIERTRHLNYDGLLKLCDQKSNTRYLLQVLHIGVFKHHKFNKVHVAEFLSRMADLKSCSFFDENRALISHESPSGAPGAKIMTYSALKLAIVNSDIKYRKKESYLSAFTELKVVDRALSPDYVLQTCPNLKKLIIDWQEELSQAPFQNYSRNWFCKMIDTPDWTQLLLNLSTLKITFPAAHSPNTGYSCPPEDFVKLIAASKNLSSLSLKGLINANHVSILDFLYCCKKLEELILDKCSVHFPHPDGLNINFEPHKVLKKLHIKNKNSPFLSSKYMTLSIARLIPNLEELVFRPEPSYTGFTLNTIKTLSLMPKLEKLEVSVSTEDSVNNMPSFVYVLREFPSLRYLTLSWGASPPEIHQGRTHRMVDWLENVLQADNANIYVQICHELHSNIYSNSPLINN